VGVVAFLESMLLVVIVAALACAHACMSACCRTLFVQSHRHLPLSRTGLLRWCRATAFFACVHIPCSVFDGRLSLLDIFHSLLTCLVPLVPTIPFFILASRYLSETYCLTQSQTEISTSPSSHLECLFDIYIYIYIYIEIWFIDHLMCCSGSPWLNDPEARCSVCS
jgi:hypothetical protein